MVEKFEKLFGVNYLVAAAHRPLTYSNLMFFSGVCPAVWLQFLLATLQNSYFQELLLLKFESIYTGYIF